MAQSTIRSKVSGVLSRLKTSKYSISEFTPNRSKSVISEHPNRLVSIQTADYDHVSINDNLHHSAINYALPFRVKFTNIKVPGYGPNNPPPIGIAVIGYNNYIL